MSKTIDALKTAIDSMAKIIDDLKSENERLKNENMWLKGKVELYEMKEKGRQTPYVPTFPTLPSVPTWPSIPPWNKEPIITWTDNHVEPYSRKTSSSIELGTTPESVKLSCCIQ
jgi:hypothetical protein